MALAGTIGYLRVALDSLTAVDKLAVRQLLEVVRESAVEGRQIKVAVLRGRLGVHPHGPIWTRFSAQHFGSAARSPARPSMRISAGLFPVNGNPLGLPFNASLTAPFPCMSAP